MDLMKYQQYQFMINEVRRRNKTNLVVGAIMLSVSILYFFSIIFSGINARNGGTGLLLIMAIFSIFSLFVFVKALILHIKPEKSPYITKIDNLKELLEDLDRNEIKVDGFYIGNRAIVAMNNSLMIADRKDILTAWYKVIPYSGTSSVSNIVISTYKRTIKVPVSNGDDVNRFLNALKVYCPNCRIGYNNKNLDYIKDVRKSKKK